MAQTDTWLDGSGNWDDPTKWSQGKKPSYIVDNSTTSDTGPENAVIGGSATETITVSGNETQAAAGVRSLTLNNYNASLVITGSLDVGVIGGQEAPAYLNVQNGSLIIDGGTLTIQPGQIYSNAPTMQLPTHAYGTVYIQNYGSYNWSSSGSAAGQTIAFQGSGTVTLNSVYNGKIVGFGSGDSVYIYGSSPSAFNVKNVTYSGNLSGNQATITYSDNTTSTLQFSVNTYLNINVSGGAAYIYGVADPAPPTQPSFFLQGLDGGYANAQQPLSFQYFGANQPTFTWSENVGGQAIILEKGGDEAYAYTPTAADAGQEIDVTVNYYDSHGVYQTQTFVAAVNSLPPAITAPGTVTNKPTISGTGEIGNTVTLMIDGKVIDTSSKPIIVKTNGTWSYTSSTLSDGQHNVSATQQGHAKASDSSNTDYFTLDTKAPVIQSVTLDNTTYGLNSTVTAKIQLTTPYDGNGDYTLGSGSKIDGMTLTGGTFTAVNDFLYATFTVDGTTAQVTNGSLATHITVNDAAGNTSAVYSTAITGETIDTTAPTLASASVNGKQLVLTYTETGSGLNGADAPVATGFTVRDGWNTILVDYVDYDVANKTATLNLFQAVANGDTVTVSYSPAPVSSQKIQDNAGNVAASFSNQAVTNNTPAMLPTIAITAPIAGDNVINAAEAAAGVTISGTSSVGSGQTVTVTLSDSSTSFAAGFTSLTSAGGAWSVVLPSSSLAGLSDHDYTITADVKDQFGNQAPEASQAITLDETAPSITGVTLDKASYKLGDTVTATIQLTGTYDGNGAYTLGAGSTLDGQTLTVGSYDATNNTLTASFLAANNADPTAITQVTNGTVADSIVVADAYGNAGVAHTAGIPDTTIDTIAPRSLVGQQTVNGDQLVLTFTETGSGLNAADVPVPSEFTVTTGGTTVIPVTGLVYDADAKTVTLTLASPVASGDNTVSVIYDPSGPSSQQIADNAGNAYLGGEGLAVTNVTPPTIAITTPIAGDNVINLAEATAGVTVSGTSSVGLGQFVVVSLGTYGEYGDYGTYTAADGSWSVSVRQKFTPLVDGDLAIRADVRDSAGNYAPQARRTVSVDETPPKVSSLTDVTSTGTTDLKAGTSVTFTLTGSEALTVDPSATLTLGNGGAAAYASGSGTTAPTFTYIVASGRDTPDLKVIGYTGSITDAAGNALVASSVVEDTGVTIDTAAPASPSAPTLTAGSDSGVKGDGLTNVTTPTVTGSAEANALVTLYDTDGTVLGTQQLTGGATTYAVAAPLSTGTHALSVTATDLAGNASPHSPALSVTVDTTPPTIAIMTPIAGDNVINQAEAKAGVTIAGTTSGVENGQNVTIKLVNSAKAVVDTYTGAVSDNAWHVALPAADATKLANGAYTLTADVADKAGNSATAATSGVTVDANIPTPVITSGPGNSRSRYRTISGTAEANATVTIMDYSARTHAVSVLGQVKADASGNWSDTIAFGSRGAHSVEAIATDAVGNSATSQAKTYGFGAARYNLFVQLIASLNPQGVGVFAPSPNAQTPDHPLAAPH